MDYYRLMFSAVDCIQPKEEVVSVKIK